MAEISIISYSDIRSKERWDAEFYRPYLRKLINTLQKNNAKPLSDFVKQAQRGQAPNYTASGTISVIRTVNVRDLGFSDTRQEFVKKDFYDSTEKGKVEKYDIVVTSTGVGTLGRSYCNVSDNKYFADGHITVLKLKNNINFGYLTGILQSYIGKTQFEQWQRGSSGQIEIYPDDILSVLIPTFPKNITEKIASLWQNSANLVINSEKLYPEAETELLDRMAWDKLVKRPTELFYIEKFAETQKQERFDAEHYQPQYKRLRLHLQQIGAKSIYDLCLSHAKGTQPEFYIDNGEVLVVKSKNVFGSGIDFENCERTALEAYSDVSARLSSGDVVINSTGRGTLGRAAFIPDINERIVAAVDLLIWSFNKKDILPEYATLFLNSPAGLAQSEMFQTGSSGQLHLYPQHVGQFLIYLPKNKNGSIDLEWQKKLAHKVIQASNAKVEAQAMLDKAKKLVEDAIEKNIK